jgi:hypothetical protein
MKRRRGATFTLMVLITSALLLGIGGAFIDATTKLTQLASLHDQQEQAKEALAGAAEWARTSVASWPAGKTDASATLEFSRASVAVTLRATKDGVEGTGLATVKPDVKLASSFLLSRKGDRWVLSRLEFKPASH